MQEKVRSEQHHVLKSFKGKAKNIAFTSEVKGGKKVTCRYPIYKGHRKDGKGRRGLLKRGRAARNKKCAEIFRPLEV